MRNKSYSLVLGVVLIAILAVMMLISLIYTPHPVNGMNIRERLQAPSLQHWLGTDNFGRDVFSRVMVGAQTAFEVGAVSVCIGLAGGFLIGTLAGYAGKWVDELLMRATDALLAFPGILLALLLVTISKPSLFQTMLAIGILSVPSFARVIRSGVLQHKEAEYVKAARGLGAGHANLIWIQIVPNIASSIVTTAALSFSTAILVEAALSYLGLGVQPPDPSWGRMLNEAQSYLAKAPWFTLAPGLLITLTVLGFNLLGDGIRDLRDKRS
ncbi:ABC transporter permease [Paenibacillus beijingensis]|uniref:Peptide ABC transporter permease n=1 Tax=Paenibacillus beijingensis TaxID=1126833 RepID=A0A0D5NLQ3_9BACL|nr:ABC transporter permease [Paenibacillus beijingensis]AJY75932.1 peptide ABC transporter permease [Paenibacillus beijingensis]